MREAFRKFSAAASNLAGSVGAFSLAVMVIIVWAATGPFFGFSHTWQLIINSVTTIVTFLMVFLIQNTQNRDSRAIHAKLDELVIHATGTDNHIVDAEDLSDEELEKLRAHFHELAESVGNSAGGRTGKRKPATSSKKSSTGNGSKPKTTPARSQRGG